MAATANSVASLAAVHSTSLAGDATLQVPQTRAAAAASSCVVRCRAEKAEEVAAAVSRRAALSAFLAGSAALAVTADPAFAAYGDAANVFGKRGNTTGFVQYKGAGFSLDVPSKWNPSSQVEFPNTVVRFEDNFDAVSNLSVIVAPAKKSSISDYGSPEAFLSEFGYLLGVQSYNGFTSSEGGFATNEVATAAILDTSAPLIDGKQYFKVSLLTRTADGDEGGKHQLITATVSDGKLYILKTQIGDKRWFKGSQRLAETTDKSFSVA